MPTRAPAMVRACAPAVLLSVLLALVPPPGAEALSVSINLIVDVDYFLVFPNRSINLTGNVTENPHGAPVVGARVRVAPSATQVVANETLTDAHGAFRMEVGGPFPERTSTLGVWALDEASNLTSGVVNITVEIPIIEGAGFEGPAAGLALAAVAAVSAVRARFRRR